MSICALSWLEEWYLAQCDGDWEHECGIEIGTLDNPGWRLVVDVAGTPLNSLVFAPVKLERSENDWLNCEISDGKFRAACGPRNLSEVIEVLKRWAGEQGFEARKVGRLEGKAES